MKNKYTVIITTFKWESFFTFHVYADSPEESAEKALQAGHDETGISYDEVLDIFEGFCKSVHKENNPILIVY